MVILTVVACVGTAAAAAASAASCASSKEFFARHNASADDSDQPGAGFHVNISDAVIANEAQVSNVKFQVLKVSCGSISEKFV